MKNSQQIEDWYKKTYELNFKNSKRKTFRVEDAEDIVQNLAVKLLNSDLEWEKMNPVKQAKWVTAEYLERKVETEQRDKESIWGYRDFEFLDLVDYTDPEMLLLIKEFKQILNETVEQNLTGIRKEVFKKKFLQEQDYKQIIGDLQVHEQTVYKAAKESFKLIINAIKAKIGE